MAHTSDRPVDGASLIHLQQCPSLFDRGYRRAPDLALFGERVVQYAWLRPQFHGRPLRAKAIQESMTRSASARRRGSRPVNTMTSGKLTVPNTNGNSMACAEPKF